MTNPPTDAVVAGTKNFAVALLAPLTAKVGVRPRIAADAGQALALCRGPGGLVVIEYVGDASRPGIEQLVRAGGFKIVAGVPEAHAAAEPSLRALGVEIARWDGRPEAVLVAVERQMGVAPAGTTAVAAPAASPPPAAPVVARPVAPAAPARPAAPAAAVKPAASKTAAAPAPVPPAPGAPAAPPKPAVPAFAADPFDDPARPDDPFLAGDPLDVEIDEAIAVFEPSAPVLYAPPPPAAAAASADWPATAPGSAEAEAALIAALAVEAVGAGGTALAAVAAQVAAGLSDLEREVLGGGRPAVDAEPIRRAAVTRLRVAAALATTPPPGSRIDDGAVHAFLGEIDALLSAVASLAGTAPEALHPSLEAVRNALVKEAIDFSEAAQRVSQAAAVPAAVPAPRPAPRAGPTRVLSASREPEPRRNVGLWVMLVLALAGAGAYHFLYRHAAQERVVKRLGTLPGAPDGMVLLPSARGGAKVLVPVGGVQPDPAQLERFRSQQQAQGNVVRDLGGGAIEIRPAPAAPQQGESP